MNYNSESELKRLKSIRIGKVMATVVVVLWLLWVGLRFLGTVNDWQELRTLQIENLKLDIEIKKMKLKE